MFNKILSKLPQVSSKTSDNWEERRNSSTYANASSRGSTKFGNLDAIATSLPRATFDCLLKTYDFLTPDFWENTNIIKSPYQQHTDLLAKPTPKVVITEVTETADA